MDKLKQFFSGRAVGFWLAIGSAAAAIIASIIYLIVYLAPLGGDRAFSAVTFVFILMGALTAVTAEVFDFKFGVLVSAALYSIAVGLHFQLSAYPFADALTKVPFFGGNPSAALIFGIIFSLCALGNISAAFFEHRAVKC